MVADASVSIYGYEVLELVGSGGYGADYRALQTTVDREVAIKLMNPQHLEKSDFRQIFKAEARDRHVEYYAQFLEKNYRELRAGKATILLLETKENVSESDKKVGATLLKDVETTVGTQTLDYWRKNHTPPEKSSLRWLNYSVLKPSF